MPKCIELLPCDWLIDILCYQAIEQGPISVHHPKEVQLNLSLNLNSELTYSGNSEFSVIEQLKLVSLLNSK